MSNDSINHPNANSTSNDNSNTDCQKEVQFKSTHKKMRSFWGVIKILYHETVSFFDKHKYVNFVTPIVLSILLGYWASYFVVCSLNEWCFRNDLCFKDNSWFKDKAWCKGLNTICDDYLPPKDPEFIDYKVLPSNEDLYFDGVKIELPPKDKDNKRTSYICYPCKTPSDEADSETSHKNSDSFALAISKKKQPDNGKKLVDTILNVIEYEPELIPAQKEDGKQIYLFRRYVRGSGIGNCYENSSEYDKDGVERIKERHINKDRPKYEVVSKDGEHEEYDSKIQPVGYVQYAFARKVSDDEYKCIFAVKAHSVYHKKNDGSDLSFGIHLELLVNVNDPTWTNNPEKFKELEQELKSNNKCVWQYIDTSGIKELDWYTFKGIAESSEILKITQKSRDYFEIKMPTSTASLVSWIKSNWLTQTKYMFLKNKYIDQDENNSTPSGSGAGTKTQTEESGIVLNNKSAIKLTQEQLETIVCPELERCLQEDFSNANTKLPVMAIRICNGSIQFATLWFFWIGMFLMLFLFLGRINEWIILNKAEKLTEVPKPKPEPSNNNSTEDKNSNEKPCNLWDPSNLPQNRDELVKALNGFENSDTIDILWSTLDIDNNEKVYKMSIKKASKEAYTADGTSYDSDKYDNHELLTFITMLLNNLEKKITCQWYLHSFFLGALASVGFLGTVTGIGLALMGTSNVLSDELTKQQSGVSDVALSLGTAFDTTMVSLTLSLIAGLVSAFFIYNEKSFVNHFKDYMCKKLMPVLKNKESKEFNNDAASPSESK